MAQIPRDVASGQPFVPRASEQNEVNRLLRQLKNITVGQGLQLDRSAAGLAFTVDVAYLQSLIEVADAVGVPSPFGVPTEPGIANFSPPKIGHFLTEIRNRGFTFWMWIKDSANGLRAHGITRDAETTGGVGRINMGVKFLNGGGTDWEFLSEIDTGDSPQPGNVAEQTQRSFHVSGIPELETPSFSNISHNTPGRSIPAGTSAANFLEDTGGGNPAWIFEHANDWVGQTIHLRAGTGAGQTRVVTSVTATRCFVTPDWDVIPAPGTVYLMIASDPGLKGVALPVNFTGRSFLQDAGGFSNLDALNHAAGFYFVVEIADAEPVGSLRFIGAAGEVFSDEGIIQATSGETTFSTGTADGTTNSSKLVDTTAGWTIGSQNGRMLRITSGAANGEVRLITDTSDIFDRINWDNQANITGLTAGDTYQIFAIIYLNTIHFGDPVIGELL